MPSEYFEIPFKLILCTPAKKYDWSFRSFQDYYFLFHHNECGISQQLSFKKWQQDDNEFNVFQTGSYSKRSGIMYYIDGLVHGCGI